MLISRAQEPAFDSVSLHFMEAIWLARRGDIVEPTASNTSSL